MSVSITRIKPHWSLWAVELLAVKKKRKKPSQSIAYTVHCSITQLETRVASIKRSKKDSEIIFRRVKRRWYELTDTRKSDTILLFSVKRIQPAWHCTRQGCTKYIYYKSAFEILREKIFIHIERCSCKFIYDPEDWSFLLENN